MLVLVPSQMYFPLLLTWIDELISAPKIMKCFPKLAFVNKISERKSNPMP